MNIELSFYLTQCFEQDPDPFAKCVFDNYLASSDALFRLAAGTVPGRAFFISRLRQLFGNDVAGQSLRAGGATFLVARGVAPHLIQAAGRWSSGAFQIYIRKHPMLLNHLVASLVVDTNQNGPPPIVASMVGPSSENFRRHTAFLPPFSLFS